MTTDQTRSSLRALARALGVQHSALSKAAHEGKLTVGVVIEHGKVRVTDAAAAAAQWHANRVPRIDELARKQEAERAALATVVYDRAGLDWTAGQLLRWQEAYSGIVDALVADALSREDVATLIERIGARLSDEHARGLLESKVRYSHLPLDEDADADEDEDEDAPIANRKVGIDISGDS